MPHFEAFCPRALPFITPDLASLVRVRTRRHGEIPNSVRASGSEKFRLESFIQLGGGYYFDGRYISFRFWDPWASSCLAAQSHEEGDGSPNPK